MCDTIAHKNMVSATHLQSTHVHTKHGTVKIHDPTGKHVHVRSKKNLPVEGLVQFM